MRGAVLASISTDFGNRLRTSRAPAYGVAASCVSAISRMPGAFDPSTFTALPTSPSQYRQGALNQLFDQVMNGAFWCVARASFFHFAQLFGHCTSVHWVAR